MFTPTERQHIRDSLVADAQADTRITAAALTGSASVDREDRWSDIDLAFRVATDLEQVVADWTTRMYDEHSAVHHLDVHRGQILYRVFLLESTLQVDLSFWPAAEFGATAPTFRLLFGEANDRSPAPQPDPLELIGMGWLYALRSRSSIERGRVWQAEYMLNNMRANALALTCLRYGVPAVQGRGLDDLPPQVATGFTSTLVTGLELPELRRAFAATTAALLTETELIDAELANRLRPPLQEMSAHD